MSAPKGNRFWEARATHGRDKIFSDELVLWDSCVEYFEWVEANPLYESKAFTVAGAVVLQELPKMRAMTIGGLCNSLDISEDGWALYRKRDDFVGIVTRVEQIIRQQKFEGASADLLNPNIIARDLGLKDKQEHEHGGTGGGPLEVSITRRIIRVGEGNS